MFEALLPILTDYLTYLTASLLNKDVIFFYTIRLKLQSFSGFYTLCIRNPLYYKDSFHKNRYLLR